MLLNAQQALASSRSSSRRATSNSRRKKRTKRRILPQEDVTDPHDVSSSSPSFLPLVFSDDEREKDILSALARMDDDDHEDKEEVKQHPTLKKTKRVVKKAISDVRVDQKGNEGETRELKVEAPTINEAKVKAAGAEAVTTPTKEDKPTPPNDQPSLTVLETLQNSPPRQNLPQASVELPQLPPRPVWTRPQQPLQSRLPVTPVSPAMPPSTRTMPGTDIRNPQSMYPYASGTITSSPQPKPSRPQIDVHSSTTRWVRNFLLTRPKDTLLPIPQEYLSDGFNLVQLAPIVERIVRMEGGYVPPAVQTTDSFPLFKAALRLILSNDDGPTSPPVQRAAEVLYTLVHARYVISPRGLDTVRRVLRRPDGTVNPVFGRCPRMNCRGMPVLPWGDSDNFDPRNSVMTRAKRYCPCCGEVRRRCISSAWTLAFSVSHLIRPISLIHRSFLCGIPRPTRVHGGLPSVTYFS